MTTITILAIGFVLGALISTFTLLALIGKHKIENLRLKAELEVMTKRSVTAERKHAYAAKNLIDMSVQNEKLTGEVERLVRDKLKAWDVPGGI